MDLINKYVIKVNSMSISELLFSYFIKPKKPVQSVAVILPQYMTEGKLSYHKPDNKFRFLLFDGVIYFTAYQSLKYFSINIFTNTFTNTFTKIILYGIPVLSLTNYVFTRKRESKTRNDINVLIHRNNAHNHYHSVLPVNKSSDRSFDLILLGKQNSTDDITPMKTSINNGLYLCLDYYPHGQLREKMPHLLNPLLNLSVNHFNNGHKDIGWLYFPTHIYPDLKTLKLSNCGIPHEMQYSSLNSLVELELHDIILDNNHKYYWDVFPNLKHLEIIYDSGYFNNSIILSPDQHLKSLLIGFNRHFNSLNKEEQMQQNLILLKDLPKKIDEFIVYNLVLDDNYDFSKTLINILVLSKCKLNPGWNIKGNFDKLLLEKSRVLSLPKLDATPTVVGGYCLDLDQIQIIDYYWYCHKFLWIHDQPLLTLETSQKCLDHGLLKISFPLNNINNNINNIDDIDVASSIASDDLVFNEEHDSYGILQIVGNDKYRLYQVDLIKNDKMALKELENRVSQNGDLLLNDNRVDLKLLLKNLSRNLLEN
jgi:hypothetical protein